MEQSRRKSRGRNTAANISQFDNVTFSPGDWQDIQELNWELEVFVRLTQEMEGNHSSGAHVILKYLELKEDLEEKTMACLKSNALYPMYCAMAKRVSKYLTEAQESAEVARRQPPTLRD
ncbi:hypothetical protein H4Q26_001967 [Puccinia striiformis f. sp. tritici PST-130]|nr:hypothetical protein H4Q26_001967 [Puccinia striiformis f. sp. tritici PST-130]